MIENVSPIVNTISQAWQLPERAENVIPTFRVTDENGVVLPGSDFPKDVKINYSFFTI